MSYQQAMISFKLGVQFESLQLRLEQTCREAYSAEGLPTNTLVMDAGVSEALLL
jgi:hypothetical protein